MLGLSQFCLLSCFFPFILSSGRTSRLRFVNPRSLLVFFKLIPGLVAVGMGPVCFRGQEILMTFKVQVAYAQTCPWWVGCRMDREETEGDGATEERGPTRFPLYSSIIGGKWIEMRVPFKGSLLASKYYNLAWVPSSSSVNPILPLPKPKRKGVRWNGTEG